MDTDTIDKEKNIDSPNTQKILSSLPPTPPTREQTIDRLSTFNLEITVSDYNPWENKKFKFTKQPRSPAADVDIDIKLGNLDFKRHGKSDINYINGTIELTYIYGTGSTGKHKLTLYIIDPTKNLFFYTIKHLNHSHIHQSNVGGGRN